MKNRKIKLIAIAIAMLTLCTVFCVAFTGCDEKTEKTVVELSTLVQKRGEDLAELPFLKSYVTYQYNKTEDRVEVKELDLVLQINGSTYTYSKKWPSSNLKRGTKINYSKEKVALGLNGEEFDKYTMTTLELAIGAAFVAAGQPECSMFAPGIALALEALVCGGDTDLYAAIIFWDNLKDKSVWGDPVWVATEIGEYGFLFYGDKHTLA